MEAYRFISKKKKKKQRVLKLDSSLGTFYQGHPLFTDGKTKVFTSKNLVFR